MSNKLVSWSSFDKNHFILNNNKLDLIEFVDEKLDSLQLNSKLKSIYSVDNNQLTCADWYPFEETSILAYGSTVGSVHVVNWRSTSEVTICHPLKNGRRMCNSVSWNKQLRSHLAAGFDSSKSEYCAAIWDMEHEIVLHISTNESVSNISWLPDSTHLLVCGTAIGWIRIHDVRMGNHQPVVAFMAHPGTRPRKVKGIRSDPFHHNIFATFSDGAGDVIRLWDLRKHSGAVAAKMPLTPSFTVVPSSNSNAVVQDIAWSPARANVIATNVSGQRSVSFFSTTGSQNNSTSSPLFSVAVAEPVRSLSWRGTDVRHLDTYNSRGTVFDLDLMPMSTDAQERIRNSWESASFDETQQNNVVDFFAPNNVNEKPYFRSLDDDVVPSPFNMLLVATTSGVVRMEVRDRVALAVSTAGTVAVSYGDSMFLNNAVSTPYPQCSTEDSILGTLNNTAAVMQYRASLGYSIDESKNLEVLATELDHIYTDIHALTSASSVTASVERSLQLSKLQQIATGILEVYKVYVWADRFEALTNQTHLSLVNCGMLDILQNETRGPSQQKYRSVFHSTLGAEVFLSESRGLCKKICGWIAISGIERDNKRPGAANDNDEDDDDGLLEVIVNECLDGFERAAAIALWHGNVNLAVTVLRKAIDKHESAKNVASVVVTTVASPTVSHQSGTVSPVGGGGSLPSRSRQTSGAFLSPKSSVYNQLQSPKPFDDLDSPQPRDYRPDNYEDDDDNGENIDWDIKTDDEHMRLVALVGMCIAGYNYSNCVNKTGTKSGSNSTWAGMCKHVLSQLQHSSRRATSYLVACCVFLLTNINEFTAEDYLLLHNNSSDSNKYGISAGYRAIIEDTRMLLEDRIGFAVTFMSNIQAVEWFIRIKDSRKLTGRLDGILITGLSSDGLDILQQYIDRYDDIQTAALLVSRIIDSSLIEGTSKPTREWIWLHEYRNLLNKWGLFIERAKLDVELGKRYRSRSASSASAQNKAYMAQSKGGGRGGPMSKGGAKPQTYQFSKSGQQTQDRSKRIMYKLSPHSDFPHIYLRCSYCGTSLPVDGMQITKAESLRSQKSVLNCCAACNKQLPRCYVCQLYMGMVNPYRELNRTMTQKRIEADKLSEHGGIGGGSGKKSQGNLSQMDTCGFSNNHVDHQSGSGHHSKSDHNVIDFGRWFFFCQHCRHGGHATCIDQWFGGNVGSDATGSKTVHEFSNVKSAQRIVCGVNACNCNCKARK